MSRPQCMVWGALAVVLLVSRAVGVAPLRLRRRPAGWLITFSPYVYAYNVIIVSVIVSAGVVGLVLDLNMEPSRAVRMRTPTKRILWIVDFGTVLLSALVGAYEGPYRMNNMIEYLNELRKINKNMNIQSSKERVRMAILLISYFGFILVMALDIWTTRSHADRLNRDQLISNLYLSFSYTYMTLILLQSQFTVGAMAVHSTLKNLNNALETQTDNEGAYKNICGNDDDGATFNGEKSVNVVRNKKYFTGHFTSEQSKKTRETVRHIALSFSNFCHIVTEVTKCHEISLLLLLVFYGIHLVITPYYVSLAIQRPEEQSQAVFQMLLWCIVHFISLILLVEPCHWTQEEVNRTHILVSLLTDRASAADNLLNAELNQFYKHLTLNKVAFSPLGMFTMGRPLCATIVGILSTYLVIIFQFQTAADRVDGF